MSDRAAEHVSVNGLKVQAYDLLVQVGNHQRALQELDQQHAIAARPHQAALAELEQQLQELNGEIQQAIAGSGKGTDQSSE